MAQMTTKTVKLPSPLAMKLAAEARTRRVSESKIICESLQEHLKSNRRSPKSSRRKKKPATFGEIASRWAGTLGSGVNDLASNPKHMDGYGAQRRDIARHRPARGLS